MICMARIGFSSSFVLWCAADPSTASAPVPPRSSPRCSPRRLLFRSVTSFGIGAPVKRREDVRLLTGQGRYTDDVNAPGQAYAAFVRSPHAHADLVTIDVASAREVAGVLGVFTGRDLVADGVGTIPTLIAERGGGIRSRDGSPFAEPPWYPLPTDRVRRVGEPIAIVIAATPAAAQDGVDAVDADYAVRPLVVDALAALADGAASLHAGIARNRCYDWECGDASAAARAIAAAAHVTRLTLLDNRLVTCFLEPRAALAEWDAAAERSRFTRRCRACMRWPSISRASSASPPSACAV